MNIPAFPFVAIGTQASHITGDLSRYQGDFIIVQKEGADDFIGIWVTGFGFYDVHFPKSTVRPLMPHEAETYRATPFGIGNSPALYLCGHRVWEAVAA